MDNTKKIDSTNTPDFFSKEMIITKKALNENQLKYTYQKQLNYSEGLLLIEHDEKSF